jgi:hypothetical protein
LRFRPRIEDREISRTARGDVSIVRLHRSSFSRITLSATKGHTLFLNAPWTEHDCREACFIRHSHSSYNTLRDRQSKGCISKNEARRQIAARSSRGQPKKAWSASAKRARSDARAAHWPRIARRMALSFAAPPSWSGDGDDNRGRLEFAPARHASSRERNPRLTASASSAACRKALGHSSQGPVRSRARSIAYVRVPQLYGRFDRFTSIRDVAQTSQMRK